jgi:hypothetical protein
MFMLSVASYWLLTVNLALNCSTRVSYAIIIASCMGHILKSFFVTLRDKFQDKLLKFSEVEIMTEQSNTNTNVELSRDRSIVPTI